MRDCGKEAEDRVRALGTDFRRQFLARGSTDAGEAAEPAQERIKVLAEALKYPTSAGPATAVLLNALGTLGAPGADAGLEVNLTWIRKTYPEIDATPVCPPPFRARQRLACPAIK